MAAPLPPYCRHSHDAQIVVMLKQRALSATLWSSTDVILRSGAQFGISILLARLLTPAEFGTFGLLLLFTGIATVFADGGLSAALIQCQDIDHVDESTVFWFNALAGSAVALGLCAIAPLIAAFLNQPILLPVLIVMAVNVLLGAFGAIHSCLLMKRLDFRTQTKAGFVAVLMAGVVSVWMAWHGYGVWALAAQAVVTTGVNTALLWVLSNWRPSRTFSPHSVRKLFAFGGYHFASTLMDMAYSRLYTLLIGKIYGVWDLGLYTNADTTQQMPGGVLVKVLSRVAFPMFSSTSHNARNLRRGMQLGIRGAMLLNIPIMLGMAVVAKPLVSVLFGAQWLPAVPILRVLCLSGILLPLHVLNLNCLMAQGHSRLMFQTEVVKKLIGVIFLGAGAFFGVLGVAWAMVAFSVVGLVINAHYTKRFIDYGVVAQVRDFMPILVPGLLMATAVYAVSAAWQAPPTEKLAGLVAIGVAVFTALVTAGRLTALREVLTLFRRT
jgi:teichuronic acid exporter